MAGAFGFHLLDEPSGFLCFGDGGIVGDLKPHGRCMCEAQSALRGQFPCAQRHPSGAGHSCLQFPALFIARAHDAGRHGAVVDEFDAMDAVGGGSLIPDADDTFAEISENMAGGATVKTGQHHGSITDKTPSLLQPVHPVFIRKSIRLLDIGARKPHWDRMHARTSAGRRHQPESGIQ